MDRRRFLQALSAPLLAVPRHAEAQRVKRIGFLRVGPPPEHFIVGFRQGLREQSLTEGQNVLIEWALADSEARLPDALAGLMRLNVDVLLASGTSSVLLTRDAARSVPVVFVAAVDPVAMGLVKSLARPGGTMTGITAVAEELNGKRLQLLQQLIPNFSTAAFLVRAGSPATREHTKQATRAAGTLGVRLQVVAARDHSELEAAVSASSSAGALLVVDDSVFTTHRARIAEFALKHRLPTMYGLREMAEAGGLITYGPDYGDLYKARGRVRPENFARRQARRCTRRATQEVRTGHQPQDGESSRGHDSGFSADPRRPHHRVMRCCPTRAAAHRGPRVTWRLRR